MCVFITYEGICLLQKLNHYNHRFSDEEIEAAIKKSTVKVRFPPRIKLFPEDKNKSYSCYRYWPWRSVSIWNEPYGLDLDEIDHPTDHQCFIDMECALDGNPDERIYEEIIEGFIRKDCPRIAGIRVCQATGYEFTDARCPLISDLDNGKISSHQVSYNRAIEIAAQKELAYLFRLLTKRHISCTILKELVEKFTRKQSILLWMRMLGKSADTAEIEFTSGVKKQNFHNIIYGTKRPNGRITGGVVQKIEKILRRHKLDHNVIRWFCLKLLRLARFEHGTVNIPLRADSKYYSRILALLGLYIPRDDKPIDSDVLIQTRRSWRRRNRAEQF